MQVAAENALYLGVLLDDGFEAFCIVEADIVHVADAGFEWRVMHDDDGRPVGAASSFRLSQSRRWPHNSPPLAFAMTVSMARMRSGKSSMAYWMNGRFWVR